MCVGICGAKFDVFALTFTFLFHYALSLIMKQKVEFFTQICVILRVRSRIETKKKYEGNKPVVQTIIKKQIRAQR